MKEDEPPPPPPLHHRRRHVSATVFHHKFVKTAVYAISLLLSFLLGYFSSPSPNSQPSFKPETTVPVVLVTPNATTAEASKAPATSEVDHYSFSYRCAAPVPPNLVRQTILDNVFNGTSPYDNFPPLHVSTLLRRKRVTGWGSYGAVFKNLVQRVRPNTIIEIGTFLGASAMHMNSLSRQLGLETQILCIDDFRGWPGFHKQFQDLPFLNGDTVLLYQFMKNVVQGNATDTILFVPFSTGSALEMMCRWGVYGDLIEVDAGHDFHSAWGDINRAYKLLKPGGVIFGHDYFSPVDKRGVRRAVDLFARVKGLRVRTDGQHWVLESV